MSLIELLLFQPEVYRRLPESWRTWLLRRATRRLNKAIREAGVAAKEAADSLRLLAEAYGNRAP